MTILPKRFLPTPAVYKFGTKGPVANEPTEYAKKPNEYKFEILKECLIAGLAPKEAETFIRPPFPPTLIKGLMQSHFRISKI